MTGTAGTEGLGAREGVAGLGGTAGTDGSSIPDVVVTGLGGITALGGDVPTTWEAMLRGESGVRPLEGELWTDDIPTMIGGTAAVEPGERLEYQQRRRLSRSAQLAVVAAAEAWDDAGLGPAGVAPERVAVAVSSSLSDMNATFGAWDALRNRGWKRIPPMSAAMAMGNSCGAAISIHLNARAGVHSTVNACSSGTQAVATAADLIRRGLADVVLAGGTEAPLHPAVVGSFAAMRALSQRVDEPMTAVRPFDRERDGMALGEGAGVLVLESERHARRRGARIYAALTGVGITSDAFHIVQPDPEGTGSIRAIRTALDDAGIAPEDVVHFNANGTGTLPGDASEARAVEAVFGVGEEGPAVTANKAMLGHTLGAAGAIESITTVLALHHGLVPPTRNFSTADDGVSLDVVHDAPRKLPGSQSSAVKHTAGFGGHNVALVFQGVPDSPVL